MIRMMIMMWMLLMIMMVMMTMIMIIVMMVMTMIDYHFDAVKITVENISIPVQPSGHSKKMYSNSLCGVSRLSASGGVSDVELWRWSL